MNRGDTETEFYTALLSTEEESPDGSELETDFPLSHAQKPKPCLPILISTRLTQSVFYTQHKLRIRVLLVPSEVEVGSV